MIQYIQRSLRKLAQPHSSKYGKRYILLDELEGQIEKEEFYVVVNLIDEVMVIGQNEMTDARDRSIVQKRYLSNRGFNCSVGIIG